MAGKKDLERLRRSKRRRQRVIRLTVGVFVWSGMAILYYLGLSLFFDTPYEHELKHKTDKLQKEYTRLSARYDSLMLVMENLSERDKDVFQTLFESSPENFDEERRRRHSASYEEIVTHSSRSLRHQLENRLKALEKKHQELVKTYHQLNEKIARSGEACNYIPSIQPVINNQLSLLTASYGMRYHPFYKTLQSHQGVDYTIPEGSRVFATADGKIKKVIMRNATSGMTIEIDHGNGYETSYHHLSKTYVMRNQTVHRGDIIGRSGDTGLSLAPHLHYEVRYQGMRVDPIHYFFMELSPEEYQRIQQIAQIGMQSFD